MPRLGRMRSLLGLLDPDAGEIGLAIRCTRIKVALTGRRSCPPVIQDVKLAGKLESQLAGGFQGL
jgi:hypothetical protein